MKHALIIAAAAVALTEARLMPSTEVLITPMS